MPCAPVLTLREVIDHPQVLESGILVESDHPQAGRLRQARPAARFSETPATRQEGAPGLGQHSAALLAELGYPESEIAALRAARVIGPAADPDSGEAR